MTDKIQDTDLLLVNRIDDQGVERSYKVSFQDFKDSGGGGGGGGGSSNPPVVQDVIVTQQNTSNDKRFQGEKFTVEPELQTFGTPPIQYQMKAQVAGTLESIPTTSSITFYNKVSRIISLSDGTNIGYFKAGDVITEQPAKSSLTSEIIEIDNDATSWILVEWATYRSFDNPQWVTPAPLMDTDPDYLTNNNDYWQNSRSLSGDQNGINWGTEPDEYVWMEYTSSGAEGTGPCGDGSSATTFKKWYRQAGGISFRKLPDGSRAWENLKAGASSCAPGWGKCAEQFALDIRIHGFYGGNAERSNLRRIMNPNAPRTVENGGVSTKLTFADNKGLAYYKPGDQLQPGVFVEVVDVDNNFMIVTAGGNWQVGNTVEGEPYYVTATIDSVDTETYAITVKDVSEVPATKEEAEFTVGSKIDGVQQIVEGAQLYLIFDNYGTLQSPYMQSSDPGWVSMTSGATLDEQFEMYFPTELENGEPTDEVLPPGTTLSVSIRCSNNAGESTATSIPLEPITPTGNVRYILGNWGISGMSRSFDSTEFTLSTEPGAKLLVICNRSKLNGLKDGGAAGQTPTPETGASNGGKGSRARGAVYHIMRQPLVITVTETDPENGGIVAYEQVGTCKGITDTYSPSVNTATFTGGNGSGFEAKLAKDSDKLGYITAVVSAGTGYVVGDELSWTAPPGNGADETLDIDWDTLIHGVALSTGGTGGRSSNANIRAAGGAAAATWNGPGNAGTKVNDIHGIPGNGGAGGQPSGDLYCTAEAGQNGIDRECGGGGGAGAGFGGGKGGGGGRFNSNTWGIGGGGGGGASWLNEALVPNGVDSTIDFSEVQVYLNGSQIGAVNDTVEALSLTETRHLVDSNPSDMETYQRIKSKLQGYENSVRIARVAKNNAAAGD